MGPPNAAEAIPKVEAAIEHVMREMSPAVKGIRYYFDEDWYGEWGIYFQVLVSDALSQKQFLDLAPRIKASIWDWIDYGRLELFPHVRFRRESEQAKLQDPQWEPSGITNGVGR